LTERTGGDLDTGSDVDFGVTRGDGVDLTESLEVIHGDLVTKEVKHDVLQGAAVKVKPHQTKIKAPWSALDVFRTIVADAGQQSSTHA
jgi:hypothetical protein